MFLCSWSSPLRYVLRFVQSQRTKMDSTPASQGTRNFGASCSGRGSKNTGSLHPLPLRRGVAFAFAWYSTRLMHAEQNAVAARGLLKESVAQRLREEILAARISPGEKIVEGKWAREYGVAQICVR